MHIYTTWSDFTKALLLALQRAASDFLALFIRVSKIMNNNNIVVVPGVYVEGVGGACMLIIVYQCSDDDGKDFYVS